MEYEIAVRIQKKKRRGLKRREFPQRRKRYSQTAQNDGSCIFGRPCSQYRAKSSRKKANSEGRGPSALSGGTNICGGCGSLDKDILLPGQLNRTMGSTVSGTQGSAATGFDAPAILEAPNVRETGPFQAAAELTGRAKVFVPVGERIVRIEQRPLPLLFVAQRGQNMKMA